MKGKGQSVDTEENMLVQLWDAQAVRAAGSSALSAVGGAWVAWQAAGWVRRAYWYTVRRRTSLRQRYGAGDGCWCVVTGASAGVGKEFALQCAAQGFNICVVARREDVLEDVAREIRERYPATRTSVVAWDLAALDAAEGSGTDAAALVEALKRSTDNGNVGMLVHFAGNSDLAQHLTDKTPQRNLSVTKLNVLSTELLVQHMLPVLLRRHRTAVITAGALSAVVPLPGFTCSAANKHFIRAYTLGAAREFRERVDFMCAHPFAVHSEIVVNKTVHSIAADVFVRNALGDLGQTRETWGSWFHDLYVWFLVDLLPPTALEGFFEVAMGMISGILNRPIDRRSINDKFPDPSASRST